MHYITEHYTEKEWEGYNGKDSWIHFFVCWCTVSINDLLENSHEFTVLI